MKLYVAWLVFLVCVLPVVMATTISYTIPTVGAGLNASIIQGTGILVTGNGSIIIISFDKPWGDLQYYPYSTNPAGYLTTFTAYNDSNLTAAIASLNASKVDAGDNIYLFKSGTVLNLNESKLNSTIGNQTAISARTMNLTINVVGGAGGNVTAFALAYQITQVRIIPSTASNTYDSQVVESPSLNVIDRDRAPHTGNWSVRKQYALDSIVLVNVTNVSIDEMFTAEITYLHQGG